jgi:hypothetical protein
MKSASYLLLYVPVCLVVMLVLEGCRGDDYGRVLRRALRNFCTLSAVLGVGGLVAWLINRFL